MAAVLAMSAAGPLGSQAATAPTTGLVTRDGTTLLLDGDPFRFTGLNIYNANSDGWCGGPLGSGPELDRALTAIGPGHEVIRSWFFQPLAIDRGTRQRDWTAFDHTLATAAAHGFKVVATLTDQWGECGTDTAGNGYKTADWYVDGYQQVQPGMLVSYRDWVAEVVARYAGDPRIAFWQLINEAEVTPCPSGDPFPFDTLHAWASDVSGLVKSIDPDHLVSLGTIGTGQCAAVVWQYQDLHAIPTIDLCEFHDYGESAVPMPGDQWNGLAERIRQCNEIGKPIFIGESGIKPSDAGLDGTFQSRADAFAAKLQAQFDAGVQGYLAWAWSPLIPPASTLDNFDIGPGDPALVTLRGPSLAVTPASNTEIVSLRPDGTVTTVPRSRISTADRGGWAVSADGDRVVFSSEDPYLAPGTSGYSGLYVRDRSSAQTIALDLNHAMGGTISADGKYVAYEGGISQRHVRVADVDARTTELASHAPDGAPGNGLSSGAFMSAGGRYVVFQSEASNLLPADPDTRADVYVFDRLSGDLRLASVSTAGTKGNGDSFFAAISDDGRKVAFRSTASNLVTGDTNGTDDVFVRDLQDLTTIRVSVASDGTQADGRSQAPFISGGHLVAFASEATNLAPSTPDGVNVYLHDLVSGVTRRIDGPGMNFPSISSDGRFMIYQSYPQVVVRDLWQNAVRTVTSGDNGFGVDMTGRFVAVASGAVASLTDLDPPPDTTAPAIERLTISPDPVASGDKAQVVAIARDVGYGIAGAELFVDTDPGEGSAMSVPVSGVNPGRVDTFLSPVAPGAHDLFVRFVDASGNWSVASSIPFTVSQPGGEEYAAGMVNPPNRDFVTTDPDQSGPTADDPIETSMLGWGPETVAIRELPLDALAPAGVTLIGQEIHLTSGPTTRYEPIQAYFTVDASVFPLGKGLDDLIVVLDDVVVPPCLDSENDPNTDPDPCVPYRFPRPEGDARIYLWTTAGSGVVTLGVPSSSLTRPGAPTDVIAAGGWGSASVSWRAPASDGGSLITGYRVTSSSGDVVDVGGDTTSATLIELVDDRAYTFTVSASNAVGTGPASEPSNVVTPASGTQATTTAIPAENGGSATTDPGGGPTADDPTTTSVTVPATTDGGMVAVTEGPASGTPPGGGYSFLGQTVDIVSTAATSATNPLTLVFTIDESAVRAALALGPADPLPDPATMDITRATGGGDPVVIPPCTDIGGGGAAIVPAPTCVSARAYVNAGTDLRLTILTAAASRWTAAVRPAAITITDTAVQPGSATLPMGGTAVWTFSGTRGHSVTERVGIGPSKRPLFDSGVIVAGRFGRAFDAAGTYGYRSTVKGDPPALSGQIAVPVQVAPAVGARTSTFTVRWSTRSLSGFVFDVRYRFQKAGSTKWSDWVDWKTAQTSPTAGFVPPKGAGTYELQASLRNAATGRRSDWSPAASIRAQ